MKKISKRRPYEQFRQLANNAMIRHSHLNKINDVVEAIGYSRYAVNGWRAAGQVPEAAIWAIKGYDQQEKNNETCFSKEELFDIISFLPDSKPELVQRAVLILRNLS
jgi:signal recognition particle subunit SEC65